jgi:hypothetical protein
MTDVMGTAETDATVTDGKVSRRLKDETNEAEDTAIGTRTNDDEITDRAVRRILDAPPEMSLQPKARKPGMKTSKLRSLIPSQSRRKGSRPLTVVHPKRQVANKRKLTKQRGKEKASMRKI